MTGYKLEVEARNLAIISYPMVPGSHQPTCVAHLISLLRELHRMHTHKPPIAHADVRLSNIIFNAPEEGNPEWVAKATLIDFDMSGPGDGQKVYPFGYTVEIDDGKRHPSALAGQPVQVQHDVFAAKHLCEAFLVHDRVDFWERANGRPLDVDHMIHILSSVDDNLFLSEESVTSVSVTITG
jgi:aminoglycoside phosphotransferase (APT) family kinase protein